MKDNQYNAQKNFIDAVNKQVDIELSKQTTTKTIVGVIDDEPTDDYKIKVKINDSVYTCNLPYNMRPWIQTGDVVTVQDLYNNKSSLMVVSKIGNTMDTPSLVFVDDNDKIISGVDGIFDEEERINHATIEIEEAQE